MVKMKLQFSFCQLSVTNCTRNGFQFYYNYLENLNVQASKSYHINANNKYSALKCKGILN